MNPHNFECIRQSLANFKPDGILVSGWQNTSYRKIVMSNAINNATKIMGMDNPWSGTMKQRLTCTLRQRYVSQFDFVWVAGERTRQFAVRISKEPRIRTGVYSCDYHSFAGIGDDRIKNNIESPKRFLFVGRYVENKGLRQLLNAYEVYRKSVSDPWDLHCCGTGPLKQLLEGRQGVADLGFRQPDSLKDAYRDASVLILPSFYEPWGVVVAEAMAAGLPVIASSECGSSVELVRDNYNGFTYDSKRLDELVERLRWFSSNPTRIRAMAKNCLASASAYTADLWAERLVSMVHNSAVLHHERDVSMPNVTIPTLLTSRAEAEDLQEQSNGR